MELPSELIVSGPEWRGLSSIVSVVLDNDDIFRKTIKKTLLRNRPCVEAAQGELKRAGTKAKFWVLYIKREGCNHVITIKTKKPERRQELIAGNEKLLLCAPERVRIRATQEILIGIADACCKTLGLHDALREEGGLLSTAGCELAKEFWKRCHLHWRRSIGARKAAWKRKGYVAEYGETPDLRNSQFHEGAKLLYDLEER